MPPGRCQKDRVAEKKKGAEGGTLEKKPLLAAGHLVFESIDESAEHDRFPVKEMNPQEEEKEKRLEDRPEPHHEKGAALNPER